MQLERDLVAAIEPGMSAQEIQGLVADLLSRYSTDVRPNGALRARPCECAPDGIGHFDSETVERRCLKCGRSPSADIL
jgi:hypothetical protein